MKMEFDPRNAIVKLCMQGMDMEENGKAEEAIALFQQAWNDAANDFEKVIAAYHVARQQTNAGEKLRWYETALQLARIINSDAVNAAFALLYTSIAKCYEDMGDLAKAQENYESASSCSGNPSDKGPFYHGTRADMQVGDLLIAGHNSNYKQGLQMNHIYFTAQVNGAGLAAALAKGNAKERVYIVGPTGAFENDPNVTNKKFPGNPTRSYRTEAPLKITGEVTEWARQKPEDVQKWRERLDNSNGEIIN